jgi:hypothetical protein
MKRAAVALLAGSLLLRGTAWAQESEPEPPDEIGRTLAQVGVGATVATAGLFLVGATLDASAAPILFLLVTPAAVGGTVCALGERGAYHSSCAVAVAGAYLGAASIIPMVWFASLTFPTVGDGFFIPTEAAVAFLAGWVVVQPVVATFGWRMFSTLKRPPPLVTGPRRPAAGPRALVLPLVSLAF